jgi:hypothetical protein
VVLEVQVGVVELVAEELAENLVEILEVEVVGLEEQLAGGFSGLGGRFLLMGFRFVKTVT